jgi:hypothetical protein
MMKLAASFALLAGASAMVAPAVETDDIIAAALEQGRTTEVFFHLAKKCGDAAKAHKADLIEANGELPEKKLLRVSIHDHLVEFTKAEQGPILAMAEERGFECRGFWATNTVYCADATPEFIRHMMTHHQVRKINGNREYSVIENTENNGEPEHVFDAPALADKSMVEPEYGLELTQAWEAQEAGNDGTGAVICTVDTGVRWTHEALIGSYRGGTEDHNWNWVGPGSSGNPPEPQDGNGHGTHCTGTIVGQPVSVGIGVAPGAQWIAAAGCNPFGSCPTLDLTIALEFCGCPTMTDGTNPDCTQAPDICSNSWGGGRGSSTFWDVLAVLREEEVATFFAAGNSGSSCDTANSPSDSELVISVGASDSSNTIAGFSSRGPGIGIPGTLEQQPYITAPGVSTVSSFNGADTQYASLSGTSMACPHAAGFAAQMIGQDPTLTIDEIEAVLAGTAFQGMSTTPPPCGGVPNDVYPNMVYGHGLMQVCDGLAMIGGGC